MKLKVMMRQSWGSSWARLLAPSGCHRSCCGSRRRSSGCSRRCGCRCSRCCCCCSRAGRCCCCGGRISSVADSLNDASDESEWLGVCFSFWFWFGSGQHLEGKREQEKSNDEFLHYDFGDDVSNNWLIDGSTTGNWCWLRRSPAFYTRNFWPVPSKNSNTSNVWSVGKWSTRQELCSLLTVWIFSFREKQKRTENDSFGLFINQTQDNIWIKRWQSVHQPMVNSFCQSRI